MSSTLIMTSDVLQVIQGTPEWHRKRAGKVTASCIADVVRKGKGNAPSVSRQSYMGRLIAQRLSETVEEDGYQSAEMRRGKEIEPQARTAYEFERNVELTLVDFVDHPTIAMAGSSPDALVGDDGLAEFKCPSTHTHIASILTGKIDPDYLCQMQWQMACTGRAWCDFVSYDPRLPEPMRLFIQRVPRDEARVAELEAAVLEFNREIEDTIAKLTAMFRMDDASLRGAQRVVLEQLKASLALSDRTPVGGHA